MSSSTTSMNQKSSISETLKSQGYTGLSLFEKIATRTIQIKETTRTNRCHRCWHDKESRCICSHIPTIPLAHIKLPIKILVLMHYKEYLSAGNDAKLLLAMMPEGLRDLYLFGREGDWEKFESECGVDSDHTLLLWPAEDAGSVDDLVQNLPMDSPWRDYRRHVESPPPQKIDTTPPTTRIIIDDDEHKWNNGVIDDEQQQQDSNTSPHHSILPTLRVIVLDGVYSQARSMFRTIQRRFPPSILPPTIALHPTTVSIYHRAQKSYSGASRQTVLNSSNPDALHICTVEAFALLMKEFGEWDETTEALVRAVEVNNLALVHIVDVRPPPTAVVPPNSSDGPCRLGV